MKGEEEAMEREEQREIGTEKSQDVEAVCRGGHESTFTRTNGETNDEEGGRKRPIKEEKTRSKKGLAKEKQDYHNGCKGIDHEHDYEENGDSNINNNKE